MNWREYMRKKIFGILGLVSTQDNPNSPRKTFVNNFQNIENLKLREYNIWYAGDSDELLNFYTEANMIEYNYEPYYDRNKTSYFWAISSTENDIKRTHSGQPRNIVDTLVNIVGYPKIKVADKDTNKLQAVLERTLKENKFKKMFLQEQLPLTLVEGWGGYKINWDKSISDYPIIVYYRADAVDFVIRSNRVVAMVFRDYYYGDDDKRYVLIETRRTALDNDGTRCLIIEKELFVWGADDTMMPCSLKSLPQLKDVKEKIKITNYSGLLAVPCVIYHDNETDTCGRSIFTGKIDLFDDLDQCLSQSSNTVRRSTTREYFNSQYLERDEETGMPIQPKAYDRKYTLFAGARDANGAVTGEPVTVTQPQVNFVQYDQEAQHILIEIISGIMSPATLGIDLAKKDNADAQREKEKVTIFTRNTIIAEEMDILEKLGVELMCAKEFMDEGCVTFKDYEVNVEFNELTDASMESRMEVALTAYNGDVMTPEMTVDYMYQDSISPDEKAKLVAYMKEQKQSAMNGGMSPEMMAMMGAQMGGENEYDDQVAEQAALQQ